MRVTDTEYNRNMLMRLQTLQERQSKLQTQVATGQRVQKPGDDPRAMGRILHLQTEQRENEQFKRNINRGNEIADVSFDNFRSLQDISTRAGEIAILSGGPTASDARAAYAEEVDQLLEQALMTGNVRHRGEHLFAGQNTDTPPFEATRDPVTGEITAITNTAVNDGSRFEISDGSFVSPYPNSQTGVAVEEMLNELIALRDAMRADDAAAINNVHANLETVEDNMVNAMSEIGAVQMRLEIASGQIETRALEIEEMISVDADADITEAIVQLNQTQLAYEAALQTGARMLNQSLLNYI